MQLNRKVETLPGIYSVYIYKIKMYKIENIKSKNIYYNNNAKNKWKGF